MIFNWCYYPLETDGNVNGIQNPLPNFTIQHGNPWEAGNDWFNGNGLDTSIVLPWESNVALFDGLALPDNGAYMLGFQIQLGAAPQSNQTILFCGHVGNGNKDKDGIRVDYRTNGRVRFTFFNKNHTNIIKETDIVSNSLRNIFCYIDHRPAGIGVDSANVHVYEDGTDVNATPSGVSLSSLGSIYPQQVNSATALIIGAYQVNGQPFAGTHYNGKVRRIHIMKFGSLAEDTPSNIAEIMNELSLKNMIPTAAVVQIAGLPLDEITQDFVRYV
ncbi:hypothetical protein EYC98_13160 [Halieaceae bacterium IMCC14734]|uniref:Uncharacterized protein n=1 Tax=Candidatus Litorirhabdus singularis TaxID=2518993 RepID=A0ABT3THL5_9GAMM|nr:hypothetical protein [Candidatus Litorirhabdus singularis]MCX2981808.1 hypothetical protein [Candidatus Litorirhabdus singularis]